MTVLTTPAPRTVRSSAPRAPRRRGAFRKVLGAVLRWTIAIALIVVLGEMMHPASVHAFGRVPYMDSH